MKTHRCFHPAGIVGGLALAAALALGARPLAAQDAGATSADATPLELVFVVFPEPAGASDALAAMSDTQRQSFESYAVVSKDQDGNVKVDEKEDKAGGSDTGKADTSGYAPEAGQAAGGCGVSDADMSQMSGMLDRGNSALILVVEDPNAAATESSMKGAEGSPEVIVLDVVPVQ